MVQITQLPLQCKLASTHCVSSITEYQILIFLLYCVFRQSSRNSVIFKLCQQVGTLLKILRPLHWNACSWPLHMSAQQRRRRHAAERYISHQKCLEGLLCDGYASFMLGEVSADLVSCTSRLAVIQHIAERIPAGYQIMSAVIQQTYSKRY